MPRESFIGQTLAGYTIRSEVGEGGTSAVFRAEHGSHGTVALKILREKLRNDRTAVTRFQREARFGERVVHPNVVRTIEMGEARAGLPFLAIEWAPGELLERYVKHNAPLPHAEVVAIIRQIADAVHAAHQAGIIHRDLKPDNVMYDPETQRVKLLDFGIATDTNAGADQRLTRAGFFVGTLMYVAPEALSGEMVTPQADQYSLATMAYFLLTGTLPYTAKTPREMFSQLLSQPPIPLNQAKAGLHFSPAIEQTVMRGLHKEPGKRFATVVAFADALQEVVAAGGAEPVASRGVRARLRALLRRVSDPFRRAAR
ncbi:MAG: serine/threonine protein kinase [Gemmatimonadaceae bacterium]|nr:serine/threonine protein kinase [Gemmatimonadaceae bacterium]